MTRASVYVGSFVAFLFTSVITLTSALTPAWLTTSRHQYGLHTRCPTHHAPPHSSPHKHPDSCVSFPTKSACSASPHYCTLYQTISFLLSLALVLQLVVVIIFSMIFAGGRQKREHGWKLVVGAVSVVAVLEIVGCAMMRAVDWEKWVVEEDWTVGSGWAMGLAGAILQAAIVGGVLFGKEWGEGDGYEQVA